LPPTRSNALAAAAARVRELAASYQPPSFAHVPDPDAAIFLCAVDHKTGYERAHDVDGRGPFSGSELMWELGIRAHRREGGLLRARRLQNVSGADVARWFEIGDETVADPDRRAALWRDLVARLERDHGGSAARLLAASGGRLAGEGGLIELLARYEAYADPLAKKSFLFAKICERRGWLQVADPESWEVAADNVLLRLALRSGLVAPGPLDDVRASTRAACKDLAGAAELTPPVLDDLLWELGRDDPDLLGRAAGDLLEPPREPGSSWY
jgi:hypothetical protein